MKAEVMTLAAESFGTVELLDSIFGLDPRPDILHRVVRWQRAKARQGTHKAKTRSETSYSGRKIYRQKGLGAARHGDRNAPIFRKGGVYKGPVPRSHAHDLPKKVRKLGLKHALSAKAAANEIFVLMAAELESGKTAELKKMLVKQGWKKRTLIIDGASIDANFARAAANIGTLDILPCQGANVYDILCHDSLVLTTAGVEALQARLS